MDGLNAYGSDSSSDAEGETQRETASKSRKPLTNAKANGLAALVGDYSDDDDSVEDNKTPKRPRLEETAGNATKATSKQEYGLPDPILGQHSIVTWNQNYLKAFHRHKHQRPNDAAASSGRNEKAVKPSKTLGELMDRQSRKGAAATNGDGNLANDLTAQQEFHNPSFFVKVVEHFGIQAPLQRQCRVFSQTDRHETSEIPDWEYRSAGILAPEERKQASAS